MAEFYGKLTGRGASVSRAGQRNYGLTTIAASWEGAIQVILSHNYEIKQNEFNIQMIPWHGHGKYIDLAKGQLNGENINLIDKYRYNYTDRNNYSIVEIKQLFLLLYVSYIIRYINKIIDTPNTATVWREFLFRHAKKKG